MKRATLVVAFCVVLCVTLSFAATKKTQHNDGSRNWNDLSLQTGDLPSNLSLQVGDAPSGGSGASGGVGSDHLSGGVPLGNPGTPDNWNGGTGNWGTGGNWSGGLPNGGSDVTINTGSDNVTLDVSASISSLVLGGASGSSELFDSGAQTLTIAHDLTVGASGYIQFTGGTTVTVGGNASNAYYIYLYNGSSLSVMGDFTNNYVAEAVNGSSVINVGGTLTNNLVFYEEGGAASIGKLVNNNYFYVGTGASVNLTSQPGGVTDVAAGTTYVIYGGFTAGANSGFNTLSSIEGTLYLANGQINNITPGGGTLTISYPGNFAIGGTGTTVGITGNVVNNYLLNTSYYVGGSNNTLNISGTLTNNGSFYVNGNGDVASVGTIANNGTVQVGTGATLNVGNSITDVVAGSQYTIYGTFNSGGNSALVNLASVEGTLYLENGQTTNITPGGTLTNSGSFAIGGGSTVTITGDVLNKGFLDTAYQVGGTNDKLTISGNLTNNAGADFYVWGNGDVVNVSTLTNSGLVYINTGATLNLTSQPNGITDVASGTYFYDYGTFNAGANNGFYKLNSVEGQLYLANGQVLNDTPGSGTFTNTGYVQVSGGSTWNIAGNALNSGQIQTNGGTITVSGGLTNHGNFYLYNSGDTLSVNTLTNGGYLYIGSGTTVNLENQPGGITDIVSGSRIDVLGSFNDVTNSTSALATLTNVEGFLIIANGQTTNITPNGGTLTIAGGGGTFNVAGPGTTVNITGDVSTSGALLTSYYDGGSNNHLNISGTLTIGPSGCGTSCELYMNGSGDVVNVGTLANSGYVYIGPGSTLNLQNQSGGIKDVIAGSRYDVWGGFNDVAGGGHAFANLNNVEGQVFLFGQNFTDTPGSGTLTISSTGNLSANYSPYVPGGTTLTINGNVDNSGFLATDYNYGVGGNTLTITGNLTNHAGADFWMYSYYGGSDVANVGSLTNNGYVSVGPYATLNLTGQPAGITDAVAGSRFDLYGTFNAGGNPGFANLNGVEGQIILYGQNFTATPGSGTLTISSTGNLTANYSPYSGLGTKLTIAGNVDNSGFLATDYNYGVGGNTLTITGNVTNHAGGDFWLYSYYGGSDVANVGSLTNSGYTFVGPYGTLNLTSQMGGITDVVAGSRFAIEGSFNDVLGGTSALAHLGSVEGQVDLYGQNFSITPGSGTLTIASGGNFSGNYNQYSGLGSTLTIAGNVDNSGFLATGYNAQSGGSAGANTLTITGNLTDHSGSQLYLNGVSDTVSVNGNFNNSGQVTFANYNQTLNVGGDMSNAGTVYVYYNGQNLNVTGNLDNSGTLYQWYSSTNNVTVGSLTNEATGNIYLYGTGDVFQVNGTATNNGLIVVNNGSTFDPPTLNNFGTINVDSLSKLVVGSGGVPGQGYTQFANGTLGEMIGAANYGVINITGNATLLLGSTLDILLQGGYNPTPGSTYEFLKFTSGGLNGTFTNILNQFFNGGSEGWHVIYDNADGFVELQAYCVTTCAIADKWLGGTDFWNNGTKWSVGVPGSGNDVTIYSGGNDNVTYNMGSSTINSLTLGGPTNGFSSQLTDGGTKQTLTILQQLVVGQQGILSFSGSGSSITAGADSANAGQIYLSNGASLSITGNFDNSYVAEAQNGSSVINVTGTLTNEAGANFNEQGGAATIGSLTNNGYFVIGSGASVTLTNQPGGIQDVVANSRYDILGNFNEGAGTNNAFEKLTSVEGDLFLANGGNFGITPNGGKLTIASTGEFDVSRGATAQITGDVNNSGYFTTGQVYGGGNSTINVTGTVNNSGQFYLNDTGDAANIGALNNLSGGYTYVGPGATLHLTNQAGGIQDVVAGSRFDILGSFNEGGGTNNGFEQLTSVEGLAILANGVSNTITPNGGGTLTISNTGRLDVSRGATAQINGNVNNNGYLTTGQYYGGGNSKINISGNLNNASQFYLNDAGDAATVGGTFTNTGYTYVGPGASLTLTNQPGGITDVGPGSRFDLLGSFTAGGNFGFAGLSSVEGLAIIANGVSNTITPSGTFTISNTGALDVARGATAQINGNVNNSGYLSTGQYYGSGNSIINISGSVSNSGNFYLYDNGDTANIGGTLDNIGNAYAGPGATMNVTGLLTNEATGVLTVTGGTVTAPGNLTNYGTINVQSAGTIDPPKLINGGTITVDGTSKLVVGSGGVPGQGYTQFANGTLGEIITSASSFGVINVTGAANLAGGTLNIMLQGNPSLMNGTEFKFLNFSAGMLSGSGFGPVLNSVFNNGMQQFVLGYNNGLGFVELVVEPFNGGNIDYWLGGPGNWNNDGQWSLMHYPTPTNDAVIYSDIADDIVTLNLGSASVNSLQIGGNDLTHSSTLTDGGTTQMLSITNGLTIGASGILSLTGGSTITAGADSFNGGKIDLENASTLTINGNFTNNGSFKTGSIGGGNNFTVGDNFNFNNNGSFSLNGNLDLANVGSINNTGSVYIGHGTQLNLSTQPGGVTNVAAGSSWQIYGSFTENSSNFGFEHLATIEGSVELANNQTLSMDPTLTIFGGGLLDVSGGTNLTIAADVNNFGTLSTGLISGGNTLTITGMLTNESGANFVLNGPSDTASIGGTLTNAGFVDVEGGSTLNVTGDVTNNNEIATDFSNTTAFNNINVTGTITNNGAFYLYGFGDSLFVTGDFNNNNAFELAGGNETGTIQGNVNNAGFFFDIENGSSLTINGNVDNTGNIYTSNYGSGSNTLTIGGTLTNEGGGNFLILGPGDTATIGSFSGTVLSNAGFVDVDGGSTLMVQGDADNTGFIYTDSYGHGGGNSIAISGVLTNEKTGVVILNQSLSPTGDTLSAASMANLGFVDLENGSTLNIGGNVTNSDPALITGLYTSYYSGTGFNTINIMGNLDNQADAKFELLGNGDVANVGTFNNEGYTLVATGATLNLTNQLGGITDAVAGSDFELHGTFYDELGMASGFAKLTSVEGTVNLYGQNFTITPGMGTLTIANGGLLAANFDVGNFIGTTLTIAGNVDNSGNFGTNFNFTNGGNTLTINGDVTNESGGNFAIFGSGDKAFINGSLTNGGIFQMFGGSTTTITGSLMNNATGTGLVDVELGSKLAIGGNVTNASSGYLQGFYTDLLNNVGGNTVTIGGSLTNSGLFQLGGPGDFVSVGMGVDNTGTINVDGGSTLAITGDVTNSGTIQTDPGHNTITISGMLTNGGTFALNGPMDMATLGSLNNAGTVNVDNGSTLTVTGAVDNSGTIGTSGGGNTITSNGLLTNEATGQINLNGPGDLLQALAGLTNGGTINLGAGSKINVGTSYNQLASGTLVENINGYGPCGNGNCGVINVNGSALLAGTLNIMLKAGFNPVVGSTFTFLNFTPGQLTGTFGSILNDIFNNGTEMWMVNYDNMDGFVQLVAEQNGPPPVPEPATLLVLIPGLMAAGYGLRRRLTK